LALGEFRAWALAERNPSLIANVPNLTLMPSVTAEPETAATTIFRNWLRYLAKCKTGKAVQPEQLVSIDGHQETHHPNEADI
jgi:hypothetical protein